MRNGTLLVTVFFAEAILPVPTEALRSYSLILSNDAHTRCRPFGIGVTQLTGPDPPGSFSDRTGLSMAWTEYSSTSSMLVTGGVPQENTYLFHFCDQCTRYCHQVPNKHSYTTEEHLLPARSRICTAPFFYPKFAIFRQLTLSGRYYLTDLPVYCLLSDHR
jgi:hypothetical protein